MPSPLTRLLLSLWTSPRRWGRAQAKRIPGPERSVPPHPLTIVSLSAPLYQLLAFLSFLTISTHPSSCRNLPRRKQNCTEHPLIVATKAFIYWTIMWSSQKLNRQGIVKWWSHIFNDWFGNQFGIDLASIPFPIQGNIPWRREWLSSPVFLPEEFHGWRSLAGYNPRVHKRDRHDGATNTFTTFTFLI